MTNQLIQWEHNFLNYKSNHKTDVFHDFQDVKCKLLIQLDNIDISHNPTRRAVRFNVYDRLAELTSKFENKIHEGHFNCSVCVQVKVVMINL